MIKYLVISRNELEDITKSEYMLKRLAIGVGLLASFVVSYIHTRRSQEAGGIFMEFLLLYFSLKFSAFISFIKILYILTFLGTQIYKVILTKTIKKIYIIY